MVGFKNQRFRKWEQEYHVKLTMAFSPCPNDTFMFHGLVLGRLGQGRQFQFHLHDVETLNRHALAGVYDVSKISFHAYLLVRRHYELLNVGAAMGFGCGPVVVTRGGLSAANLTDCTTAVPGEFTTAHLLFRLWAPHAMKRVFVPYDQVLQQVATGKVDCGIVIHEGRFTYQQAGLQCLCDLGQWWHDHTQLPVPLGGIIARRSLGREVIDEFSALLRQSIADAQARPEDTLDYVRRHAQEMDDQVLARHIRTFVNDYSLDMGQAGRDAVATMERLARQGGLIA
ncbi:MAG: hypothetical protein A2498_10065 [Lentisphaerae bacterium RIFOXYC12_FULL_60_16]|nr:MAG: hypothetical protein A2498_10065 [Lentisphaerae bacterium RIFOXYC12_FULL_60_16]OGV84793.1 MAG: hypothetical protein A2340_04465 [Lentisphaerae bacterium RIFOXYB12_FULL_60_10]